LTEAARSGGGAFEMWSPSSAHQKASLHKEDERYIMLVPLSIYEPPMGTLEKKGVGSIRGRRLGILVLWDRYDTVSSRYFA
jgi:hypothetical protein